MYQARTIAIEGKNGGLLTENSNTAIHKRWVEYAKELHNHNIKRDLEVVTELEKGRPRSIKEDDSSLDITREE